MFYQKFQQEGNNSRGDKRQHQGWWQELAPTAGCAPTTVPSEAWTRPLFPRKGKGAGCSSTTHVVFICLQYFKPIGTTRSLETFPSLFFFLEYIWKKSLQDITDLGLIQKAGSDALQKGRSVHILMWAHLLHPPEAPLCPSLLAARAASLLISGGQNDSSIVTINQLINEGLENQSWR